MMGNIIKMEQKQAIEGLKAQGWSDRKIAKELGLHRATVKRYGDSKCTTPQTGKEGISSLCLAYKSEIKDWYEPEVNPKLRNFAEHYGTLVMPSRPYR
jgi:transposase